MSNSMSARTAMKNQFRRLLSHGLLVTGSLGLMSLTFCAAQAQTQTAQQSQQQTKVIVLSQQGDQSQKLLDQLREKLSFLPEDQRNKILEQVEKSLDENAQSDQKSNQQQRVVVATVDADGKQIKGQENVVTMTIVESSDADGKTKKGEKRGITIRNGLAIPQELKAIMGENIIAQAAPILESPVGPKFRIGLSVENPEESSSEDGLLVNQVMEDSPAAQAGIEEGDIIVAINGEQAKDFKALQEAVQEAGSQQRAVKLKLNRDGQEITLKVQPTKSEEASAMNFKFVPQAGSILPLEMMPGQAGGVFQIAGPSQLGQQELTETKEQIAELKEEIQELKAMVKKLLDSADKR